MKKYKNEIMIAIGILILFYLAFSFILGYMNAKHWGQPTRGIYIFITFLVTIAILGWRSETRNKN